MFNTKPRNAGIDLLASQQTTGSERNIDNIMNKYRVYINPIQISKTTLQRTLTVRIARSSNNVYDLNDNTIFFDNKSLSEELFLQLLLQRGHAFPKQNLSPPMSRRRQMVTVWSGGQFGSDRSDALDK